MPVIDPFFHQMEFTQEPRRPHTIPISEGPQVKQAILTVATLGAVCLMVYIAPDIRRSLRLP